MTPERDERAQTAFLRRREIHRTLVAAASGRRSRASVVLTVRGDFYNPAHPQSAAQPPLPKQQVNIPPMSRDDLRSAIETPAKKAGLSFAPPELGRPDPRRRRTGGRPAAAAPVRAEGDMGKAGGDRLTAEAYTAVGGVAGAIEKTAQDAYERLTPAQKDAARRLFLRLVTAGRRAGRHPRDVAPFPTTRSSATSSICSPIPEPTLGTGSACGGAEREATCVRQSRWRMRR